MFDSRHEVGLLIRLQRQQGIKSPVPIPKIPVPIRKTRVSTA
jgi:hypothetical protein